MDIFELSTIGLFAFGFTWVVDVVLSRFTKVKLDTTSKFVVSVVGALIAGFVPADLGIEIANRVRDAVAVATVVAGAFQASVRIADRV